jgi:hypothetical protein
MLTNTQYPASLAVRLQSESDHHARRHAPLWDRFSTSVIGWVPLKPRLDVFCFWRLLIFAEWPRRTPFSGAEKSPIAFICELKKQVHFGLVVLGERKLAISDRAGVARVSNPQRNRDSSIEKRFGSCQRCWPGEGRGTSVPRSTCWGRPEARPLNAFVSCPCRAPQMVDAGF